MQAKLTAHRNTDDACHPLILAANTLPAHGRSLRKWGTFAIAYAANRKTPKTALLFTVSLPRPSPIPAGKSDLKHPGFYG